MARPLSLLGHRADLRLEHGVDALVRRLAVLVGHRLQLQLHQVVGHATRILEIP